jgi:hypothetical protein
LEFLSFSGAKSKKFRENITKIWKLPPPLAGQAVEIGFLKQALNQLS